MESALDGETPPTELQMFTHDPLESPSKQIRLLRILNAGRNQRDKISLELSTWNSSEAPEYNAISYTWGDKRNQRLLQVNGGKFTVQDNCQWALWQAWLHRPNDYIWIDSISINQNDFDEKGIQVSKMARIYAEARTVLVCVGPHENGSLWLPTYAHELRRINEDWLPASGTINFESEWTLQRGQDYVEQATRVITAFSTRPYFSRLWIVQEVAMAKTKVVLFGTDELDWEFLTIFDRMELAHTLGHFHTVVSLAAAKELTFNHAIWLFHGFQCSDPRDRLYAILGLVDWETERTISPVPDYNLDPFDILLWVISHLEVDVTYIFNAIHMFGLNSANSRMTELIAYARQTHNVADSLAINVATPSFDLQELEVSPRSHCQIDEHPDGRLFANFSTKEPFIRCIPQYLATNFSLNPRNNELLNYAQPVYSGDSLAALLCARANKGDILVSSSRPRPENLLVLRKQNNEDYNIIGQGLSVNGYNIVIDDQFWNTKIQIKLTAPEIALLWAQDYDGRVGHGQARYKPEAQAMYDPDAQAQRLRTGVILDPLRGTRATLLKRYYKKIER